MDEARRAPRAPYAVGTFFSPYRAPVRTYPTFEDAEAAAIRRYAAEHREQSIFDAHGNTVALVRSDANGRVWTDLTEATAELSLAPRKPRHTNPRLPANVLTGAAP